MNDPFKIPNKCSSKPVSLLRMKPQLLYLGVSELCIFWDNNGTSYVYRDISISDVKTRKKII